MLKKNAFTLSALILVFTTPMILATALYLRQKPIGHTTALGQLLNPPQPIQALYAPKSTERLPHKWTIMWYTTQKCQSQQCQDFLYRLNQVWKATGKHQQQTQVAVLSLWKNNYNPDLDALVDRLPQLQHVYTTQKQFKQTAEQIYLLDPHGNMILRYPKDVDPMHIFKDLKKLLRYNA